MKSLSRPELLSLLKAARSESERDWLMILVSYWHGLRASEVVGLKRSNFRDGHLTLQRLKGSLKTVQPLVENNNPLLNEKASLERRIAELAPRELVFDISRVQFWRLIQKHGKAAGIPSHKLHPHILKHSIAMQTIQIAGIENVRQWLGHKSIASTGAYLRVSDEQAASAILAAAL
ncbi:MAG TPA: tyrosine-type recombinase/integrase [Terriglobales bacterium]|nr:tyrosine-type recombinase/integrase [Terriglobales bacterium]